MTDKPYPLPMLPDVDYLQFDDDFDPLSILEHGVLETLREFTQELKEVLSRHKMMILPELVIAHLCAYLGSFTVACMEDEKIEKLTPQMIVLLEKHVKFAYSKFNAYPVNDSVKNEKQKKSNAGKVSAASPGSIVAQTIKLGKFIWDSIEELLNNRRGSFSRYGEKQKETICPQTEFLEFMLPMLIKHKAFWKDELDNKSLDYAINQITIQVGWLIGYFSHLDGTVPTESQYIEYAVGFLGVYTKKTARIVREAIDQEKTESMVENYYGITDPKLKPILKSMGELSKIINTTQAPPIITDFQKQSAIVNETIKKEIITLALEGKSTRIMMMSLYYFWFNLEALFHSIDITEIENYSPLDDMKKITDVILKTILALPKPVHSKEQVMLADQMNFMMSQLPDDEMRESRDKETISDNAMQINTRIHTITSHFIQNDNVHPEVIANVLFSNWIRLSILNERESEFLFQDIDYYFKDVITNVRKSIPSLFE